MVDLVGVEHFIFLTCHHLRRKLPLENTPIFDAKFSPNRFVSICQILFYVNQDDVWSSWLSEHICTSTST